MILTKKRYGKTDGYIAWHGYQTSGSVPIFSFNCVATCSSNSLLLACGFSEYLPQQQVQNCT